ncbi:MAG: alkaline phosphatase D family protein [Burkholderiaceae bacterium]
MLLDDRQYRSHQACPPPGRGGGRVVRDCASLSDPSRTLLGFEQERWLDQRLRASRATWTLLGQQTLFSRADRRPGPGEAFSTDTWDGYPVARQRLLDSIAGSRAPNPLIIGGDVHANWVSGVRADFDRPDSPVIASEFCGTSITSQGTSPARHDEARAENPWFLLAESRHRGYGLMTLDARRCLTELRIVDDVRRPDPAVSTLAAFEVLAGQPGPRQIG